MFLCEIPFLVHCPWWTLEFFLSRNPGPPNPNLQKTFIHISLQSPYNITASTEEEVMPLAEGRAGAGLLLPQNNFLEKISKRFRGTRELNSNED